MVPSMSIYEQQNDRQLKELETKISMLKDITLDIHKQASDMTMIEQSVNKIQVQVYKIDRKYRDKLSQDSQETFILLHCV